MKNFIKKLISHFTGYKVDLRNAKSVKEAHKIIKEILNFPDYYGENLDALNDCLSELKDTSKISLLISNKNKKSLNGIIKVFKSNNINPIIQHVKNEKIL